MSMDISTYYNEAVEELHKVRWPTRQQAVRLASIVLAFTAVATICFGAIDYGFSELLSFALSFTF